MTKKSKAKECTCSKQLVTASEPVVAIAAFEKKSARGSREKTLPSGIRLEQVNTIGKKKTFETLHESAFSPKFSKACEGGACLPWVEIRRNAKAFEECMRLSHKIGRIENSRQLYEVLAPYMNEQDQEVFLAVTLDTQMFIKGIGEVNRGASDRVEVATPFVLRVPLVVGATAFMVAHNHPSGHSQPSEADKEITKTMAEAGEKAGIPLFDHLVIGSGNYYSFAEHTRGWGKRFKSS